MYSVVHSCTDPAACWVWGQKWDTSWVFVVCSDSEVKTCWVSESLFSWMLLYVRYFHLDTKKQGHCQGNPVTCSAASRGDIEELRTCVFQSGGDMITCGFLTSTAKKPRLSRRLLVAMATCLTASGSEVTSLWKTQSEKVRTGVSIKQTYYKQHQVRHCLTNRC